MRNPAINRRSFMRLASTAAATLMLGGCAGESPQEAKEAPATPEEPAAAPEPATEPAAGAAEAPADPAPEAEQAPDASQTAQGGKALVAYFSVSGNTAAVAEAIAAKTGADLFAITPVEAYTAADTEYNSDSSRTSVERSDRDTIVVELVENTPANWDDYDVVYFGFPIWWGAQSWAVNEFLRQNSFEGKTVVPFCTSGSSPMVGSASLEAIAGSGTWKEGMRISSASATGEIDELIARA